MGRGAARLFPAAALSHAAEAGEQPLSVALTQLFPVWFAVSLLACKNVETVEHTTPAKVAKKRLKNGKEPGVTYHTLLIDPAQRQLRSEGGSDKTGLKRALHLCREFRHLHRGEASCSGTTSAPSGGPRTPRGRSLQARSVTPIEVGRP